ncbi:MAG: polysulfide reductase NrfD [Bacteroidia bacterium]|nr:polysulfide reductase NrfD [Bacteroidia bacterium]NNF81795.1 polysulfide reductase NrfD [Flavobacteriaceae bacterium]NNL80446.1 polysulfide reductase NrfD [Flavobacteriaceae bacterium]
MQEEVFVSGRNIPNIDPHLEVWHWPISVDLFFGGLAAGLLFFAATFYLLGKEREYPSIVKYAPIIAPIGITIALICLFYDLTHKLYFWRLYLTFRIDSPMSFGSWVLLFITPLSFLWVLSYMEDIFPRFNLKFKLLIRIRDFAIKYRRTMAILLIPLSIGLGIYTGILLSAFNARPLWNNAILGPLFLTSGLTTASAVILYFVKSAKEKSLFNKITLALLFIQLFLFAHMILGYYAGSEVQLEAIDLLIGGEFTVMFVGFVLILGLIIPFVIEVLEYFGYRIPVIIPATLILIGGIIFRFVMVEAGQLTRYLY